MKRLLRGVSIGLVALALILYLFAPIVELFYGEWRWGALDFLDLADGDANTSMIIVTIVLLCISLIGTIVANCMKSNIWSCVAAGVTAIAAIFCFCAQSFVADAMGNISGRGIDLGIGAILSGILLIVGAGLDVVLVFAKAKEQPQKRVQPKEKQEHYSSVDDKQNNLVRFLLTFFLGWIGSLIINHSTLKPHGYKSRTLAYIFLTMITFGIYGFVAAICNLTFDPNKERNIGYFLDGTEIGEATQERTDSIHPTQVDIDKQLEQVQVLKNLFDQGVITQEEFDAKKKQLLGL